MLRQMLRKAEPVAEPLTPLRAIRVAVERAADQAHGFAVSVGDVRVAEKSVDDFSLGCTADDLLIGLERDRKLAGVVLCDAELRSALIEVQTMGGISHRPPVQRAPTIADAALVHPFVASMLGQIVAECRETVLAGWADGSAVGRRITAGRNLPYLLPDKPLQVVRLTVTYGDAGRAGALTIALPAVVKTAPEQPVAKTRWSADLADTVMAAPACLTATLHNMRMSIAEVESLDVGMVLPLYGADVANVRLVGPDGKTVSQGRLGQMTGRRAIRLEPASGRKMTEAVVPAPVRRSELVSADDRVDPGGET